MAWGTLGCSVHYQAGANALAILSIGCRQKGHCGLADVEMLTAHSSQQPTCSVAPCRNAQSPTAPSSMHTTHSSRPSTQALGPRAFLVGADAGAGVEEEGPAVPDAAAAAPGGPSGGMCVPDDADATSWRRGPACSCAGAPLGTAGPSWLPAATAGTCELVLAAGAATASVSASERIACCTSGTVELGAAGPPGATLLPPPTAPGAAGPAASPLDAASAAASAGLRLRLRCDRSGAAGGGAVAGGGETGCSVAEVDGTSCGSVSSTGASCSLPGLSSGMECPVMASLLGLGLPAPSELVTFEQPAVGIAVDAAMPVSP
mmetsp:Transcript_22895/g.58395  ORF Transcript_22895/g.58395 Transcript_22895/m.58395 type:complete len:318 (-) Transcript_22895:2013-2966(-)